MFWQGDRNRQYCSKNIIAIIYHPMDKWKCFDRVIEIGNIVIIYYCRFLSPHGQVKFFDRVTERWTHRHHFEVRQLGPPTHPPPFAKFTKTFVKRAAIRTRNRLHPDQSPNHWPTATNSEVVGTMTTYLHKTKSASWGHWALISSPSLVSVLAAVSAESDFCPVIVRIRSTMLACANYWVALSRLFFL
jgi:hypothetical protein